MCYHYFQTDSQTEDSTTDAPAVVATDATEYSTRIFGQAVSVKLTPVGNGETHVDLDPGAGWGAPKVYAVPGDASQARGFVEGFVRAFESSASDPVEQLYLAAGLGSPALGRLHEKFGSRPLNDNS